MAFSLVTTAQQFEGTITYTTTIEGEGDMLELTKAFMPNTYVVYLKNGYYRLDEVSDDGTKTAVLEVAGKKAKVKNVDGEIQEGNGYSIDALDDQVKAFAPQNYTTEMKATGKEAVINGYKCKQYKVLKSGFVKANAEAYIWVTTDIKLPRFRYDIETQWYRMIAPIPASIPVEEGVVVRSDITESDVRVVIELNEVSEEKLDVSTFQL